MVVAGVAALVAGVVGLGYLLPVAHVATGSAVVPGSPESVFDAMARPSEFPRWRPSVARVDVLSEEPLRWREHDTGGDAITFEATERRAPSRLVTRIADAGLPFGGAWTFDLAPVEGGTRVTITEHGEVYNPVFRVMSRFVFGHTATIERYLRDLGARK